MTEQVSDGAKKIALITGITGQTGAFLAEYLLGCQSEYNKVVGLVRRTSDDAPEKRLRLPSLQKYLVDGRLELAYGDMTDLHSLVTVLDQCAPDEIYNFAAQSHVGLSFVMPEETWDVNFHGVLNLLKAVSMTDGTAVVYQAATSEMFGAAAARISPQNEDTPLEPISPYGIAKTSAFWAMRAARNRSDTPLFACNGILFNHESWVRGPNFVTRKITLGAAGIYRTGRGCLRLGNLNAKRDWGDAVDYVRAIHLIVNQPAKAPADMQDYVVASGKTHTVREFVHAAFLRAFPNAELEWQGEGLEERLLVDGMVRVEIDPRYYRPNELTELRGDASRIYKELGWCPNHSFEELVESMVDADLRLTA